jgi:hypothetical protein
LSLRQCRQQDRHGRLDWLGRLGRMGRLDRLGRMCMPGRLGIPGRLRTAVIWPFWWTWDKQNKFDFWNS